MAMVMVMVMATVTTKEGLIYRIFPRGAGMHRHFPCVNARRDAQGKCEERTALRPDLAAGADKSEVPNADA